MTGLHGFLQRWTVLIAAVAIWQFVTYAASHVYFPTPLQILRQGHALWLSGPGRDLYLTDTVFDDILPSLARVVGGWIIAAVLGIGLGTALGRSRTALDYVGPLFAFFRAIPAPALIPVFLLLFGIDTTMKLALIVFGAVWPILLNTVDGVRSVDHVKTETARSFRTPRTQWVTMVILPAALPKVCAGLRLSLSIAVVLMVVSEMVGTTSGIGYQLQYAQSQFDFTIMWTWIVLAGTIGYGLNTALLAVEHRMLRWQPSRDATRQIAKAGV